MPYQTLEEAQNAFAEISTKAKAGGLANFPKTFEEAVPNFTPGETFANLLDPFDQASRQKFQGEIGRLTSNPAKRDIGGDLVSAVNRGEISLEEFRRRVQGSPTFDPTTGPQIDTGQGKQSLSEDERKQLESGTPINKIVDKKQGVEQQAPQAPPTAPVSSQSTPAPQPQQVTVQSGDTLGEIARRLGVPTSAISGFRSGDPNLIFPGEVLSVNAQNTPATSDVADIASQASNIKSQLDKLMETEGFEVTPQGTVQRANEYLATVNNKVEGGVSSVSGEDFEDNPMKAFENMYSEILEKSGFGSLQTQITSSLEEIKKIDDKLAEEIEDINENPWLSEALRSKKIGLAQDKADNKKAPLANTLTLQQTLQDRAREEAKYLSNTALNIFQTERAFQQSQLEFLTERAENLAKMDTQVVSANGRSLLIDKNTGETIKDLGTAGTTGGVRPATAAQQALATYAVRLEQALPTIDNVAQDIADMSFFTFEAQQKLPSSFQSDSFQLFDQAARNFINATLRRESGAAIAPSEFDNAYKQYLPRAGDTADTLAEKKKNRDLVFASFRSSSGSAFQSVEELLGGGNSSGASQEGVQEDVYVTSDGIEWVKGEDGLYYDR